LAGIKGRKQRCEANGNGNGGRAGGNAHGAATACTTYHGDRLEPGCDARQNGRHHICVCEVSESTRASGSLARSGWAPGGHLPQCHAHSGH
jgi:hypothetical protein